MRTEPDRPGLAGDLRPRVASLSRSASAVLYALSVLAAVLVFLVIRGFGETLEPATSGLARPVADSGAAEPDVLIRVLFALLAVIGVGRLLTRLFARVGQPPVIGEVVAGIVLGPSLLGPEFSAWILPPSVGPFLGTLAQLGIVLYMFLVGLELDADLLRRRARVAVVTSHASIVVPFLLGTTLALYLYPRLADDVPFTSFALFLGVAMSITAFPVLARILTDRGLARTELGVVALACAAADDVTAWCLLALVVGVAQAGVDDALATVVGAAVFIALMFLVARPLLAKVAARWDARGYPRDALALAFVAVLVSALTTEIIGIHAIFGAFLLGALIPHGSGVARSFPHTVEPVVTALLLPAFFAFTGMRTEIGLLASLEDWWMCALVFVVATLGKFGGTFVAARIGGLGVRDSAALGTLMNTRGLMELIVLNIGLDLGVISPTLFAMMVLMALATTLMTAPLLRRLVPD